MLRIVPFLFVLLGCVPVLSLGQQLIEGKLDWNQQWNDKIYLLPFDHFQSRSQPIDSAIINHNKFHFSLDNMPPDQALYQLVLCHKGYSYNEYIQNGINDNYLFLTLTSHGNDTLKITGSADSLFYSYRIRGNKKNEDLTILRDLRMPIHYKVLSLLPKLQSNKIDKEEAVSQLKIEYDAFKHKLFNFQFGKKEPSFNLLALYEFYRSNGLEYDSAFFSRVLSKIGNSDLALVRYIDSDLITRDQFTKAHHIFPLLHLEDTSGIRKRILQYPANLFVIDFWASWCSPCREAIQHQLKTLSGRWERKGVRLIGINMDEKESDWIKAIYSDKPIWVQLRYIPENRKVDEFIKFNINGLPTYLVLDKNLEIVHNAKNIYDLTDYIHKYMRNSKRD